MIHKGGGCGFQRGHGKKEYLKKYGLKKHGGLKKYGLKKTILESMG